MHARKFVCSRVGKPLTALSRAPARRGIAPSDADLRGEKKSAHISSDERIRARASTNRANRRQAIRKLASHFRISQGRNEGAKRVRATPIHAAHRPAAIDFPRSPIAASRRNGAAAPIRGRASS
jgi:hypothetical protein